MIIYPSVLAKCVRQMYHISFWYVPTNFLKDPSYPSQIFSCYRNAISDIIFKEVLKPVHPEAIALLGDSDLFYVHGNQFVDNGIVMA